MKKIFLIVIMSLMLTCICLSCSTDTKIKNDTSAVISSPLSISMNPSSSVCASAITSFTCYSSQTNSLKAASTVTSSTHFSSQNQSLITSSVEESKETSAIASSQNSSTNPSIPLAPTRNAGNAKELKGNVLILTIFLSDSQSSFSDINKQTALNDENSAMQFLLGQAQQNGVQLNLIYQNSDLHLDYQTNFVIPTELADYLKFGNNEQDIYNSLNIPNIIKKYNPDNVAIFFITNKTGIDYSRPQFTGSLLDGREYSMIYTSINDTSGDPVQCGAFVYAHELLHQFGAIDLYYPGTTSNNPLIAKAEQEFPYDIMRVYQYDFSCTTICDVDQYLIGWRDNFSEKDYIYLYNPNEIL